MEIIFRDGIGVVSVQVDEYGISFCNGCAYFSTEKDIYEIDTNDIMEIRD